MTDYASTPEQLAEAIAALDADPAVPRPHVITPDAEFWQRLEALLDRAKARGALYRRHHPDPLPIDGHAYTRRRRRR